MLNEFFIIALIYFQMCRWRRNRPYGFWKVLLYQPLHVIPNSLPTARWNRLPSLWPGGLLFPKFRLVSKIYLWLFFEVCSYLYCSQLGCHWFFLLQYIYAKFIILRVIVASICCYICLCSRPLLPFLALVFCQVFSRTASVHQLYSLQCFLWDTV